MGQASAGCRRLDLSDHDITHTLAHVPPSLEHPAIDFRLFTCNSTILHNPHCKRPEFTPLCHFSAEVLAYMIASSKLATQPFIPGHDSLAQAVQTNEQLLVSSCPFSQPATPRCPVHSLRSVHQCLIPTMSNIRIPKAVAMYV